MTAEEYARALNELSESAFDDFKRRFGGAADRTRAEAISEFAYSGEPERWDRIIVFQLRALGVSWVKTEAEKLLAVAERNAAAAEASARAAAESAKQAGTSARFSIWSVAAALLGSLITVALARGC